MTPSERVLDELASRLRGPRRARLRLLDEIEEDLQDAIAAERVGGLDAYAAEELVASRFGSPTTVARVWNADQASRRRAAHRNTLILMIAVAIAGALGITQHASGKNSPAPTECTPTVVATKAERAPNCRERHDRVRGVKEHSAG
jgi:hypothetical protein